MDGWGYKSLLLKCDRSIPSEPILAILTVLRSFREAGITPTSNLIFFLDGEEEQGSPHLGEYMERWRDRLDDIDIWLFFDGPAHPSGRPQIVFGVRGSMGMEVTVYGASRNLHSGHYGNWAPDTGNILARLLASMKDDTGRVLIEGWYDTVEPIGEEERAALEGMPAWDQELKRELGLVRTEGEPETLPERLMVPALNVRGITSGNTTGRGNVASRFSAESQVAALVRVVQDHAIPERHTGPAVLPGPEHDGVRRSHDRANLGAATPRPKAAASQGRLSRFHRSPRDSSTEGPGRGVPIHPGRRFAQLPVGGVCGPRRIGGSSAQHRENQQQEQTDDGDPDKVQAGDGADETPEGTFRHAGKMRLTRVGRQGDCCRPNAGARSLRPESTEEPKAL